PGAAVVGQGDGLAVEDEVGGRQAADDVDDLRHALGDVVEGAGEDGHLVTGLVHLHPDAVDLAVGGDGGADVVAAELGERAGEVRGGGGEHGTDRLEDRRPELLEGRGAAGERGTGDRTGERAEHRG